MSRVIEMSFEEVTAHLGTLESVHDADYPRFLFRGQSKAYDSVNPTLSRLFHTDPDLAQHSLQICHETMRIASGLTGYRLRGILDVLALLQHYGWWTPFLDLTGSAEVALWFAYEEWKPEQQEPAVMYVIDTAAAQWATHEASFDRAGTTPLIVDHDFLLAPIDEGGLRARWLRQHGFAITTAAWRDPDAVKQLNFLDPVYESLIYQQLLFRFPADYKKTLGNLYNETGDPLPSRIQGALRMLIHHLHTARAYDPAILQKLLERCDGIYKGPSTSGVKSLADLKDFILKPVRWAHTAFLVWLLKVIIGEVAKRYPEVWSRKAGIILRALGFAEVACRAGTIHPEGFTYEDIRKADAVAMPWQKDVPENPTGNDIVSLVARAVANLADVSQVSDYGIAAYAGVEACLQDCFRVYKILNMDNEEVIINKFDEVWLASKESCWNDETPVDSDLFLGIPQNYLKKVQ